MGSVLIQLIPLVIGCIAMPSWSLLVLALLSNGRKVFEAIALVGGVTLVRLLQGIIFGFIVGSYELNHQLNNPGKIVSVALIVLGVLMFLLAARQAIYKDDLKITSIVSVITPLKALGVGVLLAVTSTRAWIFTLAALGVIDNGGLDFAQSVIAYLLYVLGAEALLIAPIIVSARSSVRFEGAAGWLEKYNRPILVVVSIAVGCFFLWRGITGVTR